MLSAQPTAAGRSPAAGSPRRKPLYLAARKPIQVGAQAQSLVVRHAGSPTQRIPLARIDRIVCNRHTDWSGEALALCLAHGITLTWLDGSGCALGDCSPRLAEPSSLDTAIERFLELPGWASSYGNWLRRRRMAVLFQWAHERLEHTGPVSRDEWETAKREFVYKGALQATLNAELRGWCHALIVARLHDAGLHTRYWAHDGEPLELAEDLSVLLWASVNLAGGCMLAKARAPRVQAMAFEAAIDRYIERICDHLAQLRRHVAQALDSWL